LDRLASEAGEFHLWIAGNTGNQVYFRGLQLKGTMQAPEGLYAVHKMRDPSLDDLTNAWWHLAWDQIDMDLLASMIAVIRIWPSGRLATGSGRHGKPIVISWERVGGSVYVTMK
jgi:hypothetical protein